MTPQLARMSLKVLECERRVGDDFMYAPLDTDAMRMALEKIDTYPLGDLLHLLIRLGAHDYVDAHTRLLREHASALLRDRLNGSLRHDE